MFFVLVFLDGQYRVINVSLEYINDIDFKMKLFKYLIASFVIYLPHGSYDTICGIGGH